jgi:hypothetical protein
MAVGRCFDSANINWYSFNNTFIIIFYTPFLVLQKLKWKKQYPTKPYKSFFKPLCALVVVITCNLAYSTVLFSPII